MTKLEELLKWMDDAEYAPSYGELREKIKQLITEEQQVKNCDLADVVGQSEQYHCELYDFGRQKKRCEKQCDSCKWMEEKQ